MSQDGYTATEALAALAIVGMAVGSLAAGMKVVGLAEGRASSAIAPTVAYRTASSALDALFRGHGPFRSNRPQDFHGDRSGFQFACGEARCTARLDGSALVLTDADGASNRITLPSSGGVHLTYASLLGASDVWPPAQPPPPAPQWEVLSGVEISDDSDAAALAFAPLWQQQSASCQFDVVTQDCRGALP